jgi:ankyrin repeat protein
LRQLLSALPDDPRDYKESLITRNGRWLKGTCEWIWKTQEYSDWKSSGKPLQLLWITGGPGKGKTMLAQFLISHHSAVATQDSSWRKLIYFFCGTQDGRNSGASILRGLVYQLLDESKTIFRHIQDTFSKHGQSLFSDDRFETLWKMFNAMIRDESLDFVTCIVDGLDECIHESVVPFLVKIQTLFAPESPKASNPAEARLKAIFISRYYPELFENFLATPHRLQLDPEHNMGIQGDVSRYINHRMHYLACAKTKKPQLSKLRANVRNKFIEGADRSYLSVRFAIKSLEDVICPELEQAISRFPRGLDAVCTRMLQTVPIEQVVIVIALLRWVTTVNRPMTLHQLGEALRLSQAEGQDLGDAAHDFVKCAKDLLVVVNLDAKKEERDKEETHSPEVVVLVHASVGDFLHRVDNEALSKFRLQPSINHQILAERMLEYIQELFTNNPSIDIPYPESRHGHYTYRRYPFLEYALISGLQHFLEALKHNPIMSHTLFDHENPAYRLWLRALAITNGSVCPTCDTSLVNLAALLGYPTMVEYCVSRRHLEIDERDGNDRIPLFYAVLNGQTETVKYLLSQKANPNAIDVVGKRPLHIACACESSAYITRLMMSSVRLEALGTAVVLTEDSRRPGSILDDDHQQDNNDDHKKRYENNHTSGASLIFAAAPGSSQDVQFLLDHAANLNTSDVRASTALYRTTEPDIVEVLIAAGSDMYAVDAAGMTAFHVAAMYSEFDEEHPEHQDVVTKILAPGFPIDLEIPRPAEVSGGATALQIAAGSGCLSTVRFL